MCAYKVAGGKIRAIDGGVSAERLRKYLERESRSQKDPESVLQCAEVSFGANPRARTGPSDPEKSWRRRIVRPTVETEKRLGTMHIAFGDSRHGEKGVEGHTESDVHLDFVIPRLGLTVEVFKSRKDFEKKENGMKVINEGSWNFV